MTLDVSFDEMVLSLWRQIRPRCIRLIVLESGAQSGAYNMALDEQLLEWARSKPPDSQQTSGSPAILIVRTYQWEKPTLSLGVNQSDKELPALLKLYQPIQSGSDLEVVRRPTGGRAILHGEDVSFSFITNIPLVLKLSLAQSYTLLTDWVQQALAQCGLDAYSGITQNEREYLRSAICFETHTPSDLVERQSGMKVVGSAQLRREGGILQHGAAFLNPFGIQPCQFSQALFSTVQSVLAQQGLLLSDANSNGNDCEQWFEPVSLAQK
ncbi:MAG: hypothetical protein K2X01_10015 [Cyanobacteria bacterium]|nr:hypothetical protein [Cyanobacteriota bacterium]